MRYRAVFFDAGETLVHPHPSFPELLTLTLREEGIEVDPAAIREAMHLVSERFTESARRGELWSTSAERSREFWADIYRLVVEGLGHTVHDGLVARLYGTFTDLSNYRLFPDVEETLRLLERSGVRLGVVSNFEEWLERLLESLGVLRFFDVRIISGVEGMEKPDPRIFRLALDRTGVEPEEAVYVGDSPEFDVDPAAGVGMFAVLIDRRGRYPQHDGARITTLDELPAVIGLST